MHHFADFGLQSFLATLNCVKRKFLCNAKSTEGFQVFPKTLGSRGNAKV